MNTYDMTESIAPKSDQANAEDFLTGPRTFTIAEARKGDSAEQPFGFVLAEFPHDRPFKPSKTVRRIMVAAWGVDAASYVGKRMTLYRDPAVKFGGMDVGGIRVSHMSGIDKPLKIALAVSKGRRAMYVVQPLPDAEPKPVKDIGNAPEVPEDTERAKRERQMFAEFGKSAYMTRDERLAFTSKICGRTITTSTDLDDEELESVIAELQLEKAGPPPQDTP